MVNWFKRRGPEDESESEGEEENVESESEEFGEPGADNAAEWLPNVTEVTLDIDGKSFLALSLYELPGLDVMAAQQAREEDRLPALWLLAQKAFEQEALDRLGGMSFTDVQQVLFTWTLLSGQAAAAEAQRKGAELIKKVLGDKAASDLFGGTVGDGGPDDDGRPGRKFY